MLAPVLFRSLWCLGLIAMVTSISGQAIAAQETTLDDIQSAWQDRAAQFSTFRIEWTNEYLFEKGIFTSDPFAVVPEPPQPPADTAIDRWRSVLYDHGRMRYASEGEVFGINNSGGRSFIHTDITSTWDGKQACTIAAPVGRSVSWSTSDTDNRFAEGDVCIMLKGATVELQRLLPFDAYRFDGPSKHDGQSYLKLTQKKQSQNITEELWLQASPPYLPARQLCKLADRVLLERTLEYSVDPQGRNYPSSWKTVIFDEDGIIHSWSKSKTTSFEFKPQVSDKDFLVDLPGTQIHDETKQD